MVALMLKRSFIYNLHRDRESLSKHAKLSANILSRVTKELDKYPLPYRIDYSYPYHLIVYCNGSFSIHNGGFNRRIDFIPLKQNGHPYNIKYERGFMTPRGLVNYILRTYGTANKENQ